MLVVGGTATNLVTIFYLSIPYKTFSDGYFNKIKTFGIFMNGE